MPKAKKSIAESIDELDSPYEPQEDSNVLPNPEVLKIKLDPKNPLSPYQTKTFPRQRPPGQKKPWTDAETEALEKGMQIFGNDWKAIKSHFSEELSIRTNVNLKDRARNMKRKLVRMDLPLGVWDKACK